jgi:hypothetical protein
MSLSLSVGLSVWLRRKKKAEGKKKEGKRRKEEK